jgi:hypothetical protein
MEYVHYNLRLRNAVPCVNGPYEGEHGKLITKLGDWVSAGHTPGAPRPGPATQCL